MLATSVLVAKNRCLLQLWQKFSNSPYLGSCIRSGNVFRVFSAEQCCRIMEKKASSLLPCRRSTWEIQVLLSSCGWSLTSTCLLHSAGPIIAHELQPAIKSDSKPVVFILELLLKGANSSLQSKQRNCSCACLRLGHWNMSWLETLQWKKKMKPQWKINPAPLCHIGFIQIPFETKAKLISVKTLDHTSV